MKGKAKGSSSFWLRLMGLSGALVAVIGGVLLSVYGGFLPWVLLLIGLAGIGLSIGAEVVNSISLVSGRGAMGVNVAGQIVLGILLFLGVNLFAFRHYQRYDLTRDHHFTLPATIKDQLGQLQNETDIVVLQTHVAFGQRSENRPDKYDLAAQKQIIEKVYDLVEMFQDLGARFRVKILDAQNEHYETRLQEMRADPRYKALVEAIDLAPENSIFIHSDGKLQRLGFQDIYQVDKEASRKKGNLVLNYQGEQPLANKIFNIEEKRPRIALGVIHTWLGLDGLGEQYGMRGLKKLLNARGYDYKEIVLKHKWEQGQPEHTVLEFGESRFEQLDDQIKHETQRIKIAEKNIDAIKKERDKWTKTPLAELQKDHVLVRTLTGAEVISRKRLEDFQRANKGNVPYREIDEDVRKNIVSVMAEELDEEEYEVNRYKASRKTAEEERAKLGARSENLAEMRRITDMRVKANRVLADCDMLILPRNTFFDVVRNERMRIPAEVFNLDTAQVDAIKDFIKSGKPVLFCLGPSNEPGPSPEGGPKQEIEDLLAAFNVELPNQTILYDVEVDDVAQQKQDALSKATSVDIPATELKWVKSSSATRTQGTESDYAGKNDVRTSLQMTSKALGANVARDLMLRQPRPVYLTTGKYYTPESVARAVALAMPLDGLSAICAYGQPRMDKGAVFLMSNAEAWNEEQPFTIGGRPPQYKRPSSDDPTRGTLKEKRRGPFPLAVAVESEVPISWYSPSEIPVKIPKVRLVVIGAGTIFNGDQLSPMKEKIFLDVSNWLLGREDLLSKERTTWSYPRVQLVRQASEEELAKEKPKEREAREKQEATALQQAKAIRSLSAWLLLPCVFAFLGTVVWLVRRLR